MDYEEYCRRETARSLDSGRLGGIYYYRAYEANEDGVIPPYTVSFKRVSDGLPLEVCPYSLAYDTVYGFVLWMSDICKRDSKESAAHRNKIICKSRYIQNKFNKTENELREICLNLGGELDG